MWNQTFPKARALSSLDVSHSYLSDGLLSLLAEANLTLRTVSLSYSGGFTFDGISLLLSKNRSVESLDLERVYFLSDQHMSELCKFLGNLTFINLSLCSKVGNSTFYNLVRSCTLLREIRMERTGLGNADFMGSDTQFINSKVRSLHLARNYNLCDEWCIRELVRACPELQFLDVSHCPVITGAGVSTVLEKCPEIMYLDISDCNSICNLVVGSDSPRLEVLRANGLVLHNQALATIGRRCSRLMVLDLQRCFNLTDEGVKEVTGHCKALREINLRHCKGVSVHIVPWLVFSRPSLRKITPPNGLKLSENQRNLFLRHGCLVYDGCFVGNELLPTPEENQIREQTST
ncbi:hypothetical protein CDL15_Pgr014050 [Punica granatum]|nr:hypothetical protein CDL15_Pgr014050 [Punica granatum]